MTAVRVRVEQTALPGIGVRHDLSTESGYRIGVVLHRTGQRDLVLYDPDDPDSSQHDIPLTDGEAVALADILGAPLMLSQLTGTGDLAPGLLVEQITVPARSHHVNHSLGDVQARSRTDASVTAVLRDGQVITPPDPTMSLAAGDVLVVVGSRTAVDRLTAVLADDDPDS